MREQQHETGTSPWIVSLYFPDVLPHSRLTRSRILWVLFFSSWLVWLLCVYIGSSVKGLFFFFFFSCWLLFLDVFRVSRCHVTRQTCHVTYITATPLAPLSHPLHHLSSLIALHSVTNFPFFSFFLRHSQSQVWKLFDLTADNDACLNHYQISAFEVD